MKFIALLFILACQTSNERTSTIIGQDPINKWELTLFSTHQEEIEIKYTVGQGTWANRLYKFTQFGSLELDIQEPEGFYFGEWKEEADKLVFYGPYYSKEFSYSLYKNGEKLAEELLTHQPRFEYTQIGK